MGKTIPLSPDQGLYEGIRRYGQTQQRSADLANASTDAMLQNAVRAKEAPEQDYRRYRAKGAADIKNYKDAEAAGLPVGGKASDGKTPSLRKSSFDFRRGLQDGGITNNYGIAAFMGHAQAESQFNPGASNTGGEDSHGIMQTNAERNQRRVAWTQKMGGDPNDPYWQGRYAAWENTQGPEKQFNVNNAKNIVEANNMLARSQRYNPAHGAAKETQIRLGISQAWLQKMTKEKSGQTPEERVALASGGGSDTGDSTQEYPEVDPKTGKRYAYRFYNEKQVQMAKENKVPGSDRIVQDWDAKPDPKTGRVPYRLYDPNPTTAVPEKTPVPVVTEPVPVPVPGQQAALPAQAQAPVQPVVQPVPGGEDTENVAPTEGF